MASAEERYQAFRVGFTRNGGEVHRVADLREVSAYAIRLARARSPAPRVVIERGACDAASWDAASDIVTRVFSPSEADPKTLRQDLIDTDVGVGMIDHAVASTGQAVIYSSRDAGRLLAYLSPIYVGVVTLDRFVGSLADVLSGFDAAKLRAVAGTMTLVCGASSSGDIEAVYIHGMHGPLESHVLVLPATT